MARPKVFVTRMIPDKGLNMILEACDTTVWMEELPPKRDDLLRAAHGLDGLLCLLTDHIDGEVMDAGGASLKVISNHAVGVDNIDLPAAAQRGLPVGNTPGILTDTTADFAFGLILAAARRIVEGQRCIPAGGWKTWGPSFLLGVDVFRATLGIVGFGRIGKAMARRARGFEMRVIYSDQNTEDDPEAVELKAERVDLDDLLAQSDFVSIHTPLTPETRGLFNASAFEKMKPGAILINTARGPIVDQEALYNALSARRIAAAAIDVTDPEPLPTDHPLLTLENLIVTPHIASASIATREKMATMAAQNLLAGVNGERLPYCVNPEVYNRPG
jgi:glyoxylate reductase